MGMSLHVEVYACMSAREHECRGTEACARERERERMSIERARRNVCVRAHA